MVRRPKQTFLQRRHTDGQEAHEKMFNTSNQRNVSHNYNKISPHTSQNDHHQKKKKKNPQTINARECVERKEPCYTVDGNVNWDSHHEEQYGFFQFCFFLKKLKIELRYDPEIPLQGTYPEKNMIQKDTCTSLFIAVLFTIVKTWKQPKRPSTEEWMKKIWCIYIYIYIYNRISLNH